MNQENNLPNHGMAEQHALDLGQRQHTLDAAGALGIQQVQRVMEHAVERPRPAGTVEEAGLRASLSGGNEKPGYKGRCHG